MKIVTIVGARPQFIKSAPVSRTLKQAGHPEVLVHNGQHYGHLMSQVFFRRVGHPASASGREICQSVKALRVGA